MVSRIFRQNLGHYATKYYCPHFTSHLVLNHLNNFRQNIQKFKIWIHKSDNTLQKGHLEIFFIIKINTTLHWDFFMVFIASIIYSKAMKTGIILLIDHWQINKGIWFGYIWKTFKKFTKSFHKFNQGPFFKRRKVSCSALCTHYVIFYVQNR